MIEKHRKEDKYYEDLYDRSTIEILKELEKDETDYAQIKYSSIGAERAQRRKEAIEKWQQNDKKKDDEIKNNPPKVRYCEKCKVKLKFDSYIFVENDELILAYNCPNVKEHRVCYYKDGNEYVVRRPTCKACGGQITMKTKREKLKLTIIDECKECNQTEEVVYEISPKLKIDENDREKYCKAFIGTRTFFQDLEKVAEFGRSVKLMNKEKSEQAEYEEEVEIIEKIKVPKLESKLRTLLEASKFMKFQFEKTKVDRFVVADFSVQDDSDREENESLKLLKKAIIAELFHTNWRLMSTELDYRLGMIYGKLKGFEDAESIRKLAKEVKEKEDKETEQ